MDGSAHAWVYNRKARLAGLGHYTRRFAFNQSVFDALLPGTQLRASALGIDMSPLSCMAPVRDPAVQALVEASYCESVARIMFDADYVQMADACTKARTRHHPQHKHLHEMGWVGIDDWGLDLSALRAQSTALLDEKLAIARTHKAGVVTVVNPPMPALMPLLSNRSLALLLESYLGGPVRYDGATLLHVSEHANPSNYQSALWHHDRCGNRVKVFVFLHDVLPDGRPTIVADRTHRTWYYQQKCGGGTGGTGGCSRIAENYVLSRHSVSTMVGRAGGGFVFDTNSLHRGNHQGNRTRTTVILEFHRHQKIGLLRAANHDGPCPQAHNGALEERTTGKTGFALYPCESPECGSTGKCAAAHALSTT